MRKVRWRRAFAGALTGLLPLSFVAACSDTTSVMRYDTVAAARMDRLFERGWLPDVLPPSAGPILEAHDLDSNGRCATARFPSESFEVIASALSAAGFESTKDRTSPPSLRECPFAAEDSKRATAVFRRRNPDLSDLEFAAVSRTGEFFYWSAK